MIIIYFFDRALWIIQPDEQLNLPNKNFLTYNGQSSLKDFVLSFDELKEFELAIIEDKNPEKILEEIISEFKYIEAAGGLVRNSNQEFLVIERLGVWDLPKGKMEKGEKPLESAIREIEEECNVSGIEMVRELQSTYHTYRLKSKFIVKKTYWFEFAYHGSETPKPQQEEDITFAGFIKEDRISEIMASTYPSIKDVVVEVFADN